MSIFRRRLMMGGRKPIEYLEFEDRRVWEICAYRWGYTQNMQEVDGVGGVLGNGVIAGNDDTIIFCDHMFAASYAIGAHGSVPATAARTVQYRVELYVNGSQSEAGAPWEIATPATATKAALHIVQYGTTMSVTALKSITLESWADASYWESQTDLTYNAEKGCWECLVTVTNACQYLRIGLRAAAGVSVSWKVVSVGVTKVPQGITTAQCAAVSSLGTNVFDYNNLLTAFTELRNFTRLTNFNKRNNASFFKCFNLTKLRLPAGTTIVGESLQQVAVLTWNFYPDTLTTFGTCYNIAIDTMIVPFGVTSIAQRAWSGWGDVRHDMRWIVFEPTTPPTFGGNPFYKDYYIVKVFVPNDSVDAYKAVSQLSSVKARIYPISDFETYFPGESYVRVP